MNYGHRTNNTSKIKNYKKPISTLVLMASLIRTISRTGKQVIFLGTTHSIFPKNLAALKRAIFKYKPDVVLVESGRKFEAYKSESDSIKRDHEVGFCAYWANRIGALVLPNDPSRKRLINAVSRRYGKELAMVYFIARDSTPRKIHKEIYYKNAIGWFREDTSWSGFDYSYSSFCNLLRKHFGSEHPTDTHDFFNPCYDWHKFHEMSRSAGAANTSISSTPPPLSNRKT